MNTQYDKSEQKQHSDKQNSFDQPNTSASFSLRTPQEVADEVLGHIRWVDPITGYLECPGKGSHSAQNGPRDCRIRLDGTPTIHCVHESCREPVQDANRRLRDALHSFPIDWSSASVPRSPLSSCGGHEGKDDLAKLAAEALPHILQRYACTIEDLKQESPVRIESFEACQAKAYLRLFTFSGGRYGASPHDVFWIGDTHDSGTPACSEHWRTIDEWLDEASYGASLGPYLCTSVFKPGTFERKSVHIQKRVFLVVECDRIDEIVDQKLAVGEELSEEDILRNKTKSCALFRWLRDAVGLKLRAVVDSGNKSLHAHFEIPPADILIELKVILPQLKCDPCAMGAAQPVRMAGYVSKSGRRQPLIYADYSLALGGCQICRPSEALQTILEEPLDSPARQVEPADVQWQDLPSDEERDKFCDSVASSNSSDDFVTDPPSGDGNLGNTTDSSNSFQAETPKAETTSTSPSPGQPKGGATPATPSNSSSSTANWISPLHPNAFHGIAGQIVRIIEPHTEADPAALLIQLLTALGNMVGRSAYINADGARHHLNIFTAIVGATSKGRKGTAWNQISRIVEKVEEQWKKERVTTGLSSGEGLIWAVRDAIVEQKAIKGSLAEANTFEVVVKDPGIDDKRLLVIEGELANALKAMARVGNTLSPTMRQAWDGADLNTLVKNSAAKATAPHISVVGHITREELLQQILEVDAANGFANRFLWIATRRSKCLPEGGAIEDVNFNAIVMRLYSILEFSKTCGEIKRADATRAIWREIYPSLSEGRPGMVGAVTGRAEAQVMRLSALYALLDKSKLILPEHHFAAMALWEYSKATVQWIFGQKTGDSDADKILAALKRAGRQGLSRTSISQNVFRNNRSAHDLDEALQKLVQFEFAEARIVPTQKSTEERWFVRVAPGYEEG